MRRRIGVSRFEVITGGVALASLAFVMLWTNYSALPPDVAVLRNLAGETTRWAPKTPLTVFRVAIIGLVSVLAAAVMLLRSDAVADGKRRVAYSEMFSILLLAAGLKSVFQAAEIIAAIRVALEEYMRLFQIGTLASALVGGGLALLRGWPVLTPVHRSDWRMTRRDHATLWILAVVYLSVVAWPLLG